MIAAFRPLLLTAALGIAGTAAAQDTSTPSEAPAPQTGLGQLSLGETVVDGRIVGEEYTLQEHGDWSVRCVTTAEGQDPCQLYQLLANTEGQAIAEISLFPLAEGGAAEAGATVITPLETLLSAQVTFQVDDGPGRRYPFTFCTQIGCVARIGFTAQDIASMRAGALGRLFVVPVGTPDRPVQIDMSLTGFTAGYNQLIELQNG